MRRFYNTISFGICLLLLATCLEPIDLDQIGVEERLVVDALITDQPVKQRVVLSRTVPLNSSQVFAPESGASVSLEDNNGFNVSFAEVEPGIYETPSPFAAQFGVDYRLLIDTKDGQSYESAASAMIATPAFDSLYAEYEPFPSPRNPFGGFFNFYVDSRSNPDQHKFYRWTWNQTYQLRVPNPSRWLWTGGNTFIIRELASINDSLQVEICWNTDTSTVVNIKKLIEGESEIVHQPIHRFHSDSGYMKIRYSIIAKQYAISEESYRFWNLIKESGTGGFLYDKQVGTISGNIKNVSNGDEPVLGYFEVVQERSQRKFYTPRDFHKQGYLQQTAFVRDCSNHEPIFTSVEEIGAFMAQHSHDYTLCYFVTPGIAAFCRIECADCTYYAESNKKPDFW